MQFKYTFLYKTFYYRTVSLSLLSDGFCLNFKTCLGSKWKYERYTNVTETVSAIRIIVITPEATMSFMQYTTKTNFILNL